MNQGLGPFVARDLHRAGAEVVCLLGTAPASVEAAREALRTDYQIEASGYVDLDAMLAAEDLDALAILSPPESHEGYLRAALAARLHVLCEKPFIWGGRGIAERTAALVSQFSQRRLAVWENCQWPYTLPAFRELHPGALARAPRRFGMRLSPTTSGLEALRDAVSHPLSLLQALAPSEEPRVEDLQFRGSEADLELRFHYRVGESSLEVEVRLVQTQSFPRDAAYGVDGRWAQREVRTSDYGLFLTAGATRIALKDPLSSLIADFVRELREARSSPPAGRHREIVQRMQLIERLVTAYSEKDQEKDSSPSIRPSAPELG